MSVGRIPARTAVSAIAALALASATILVTGSSALGRQAAPEQPAARTAPAVPAAPTKEPKVSEVKKRVDALYEKASAAGERYDTARIRLQESRQRLHALRGDVATQQAKVAKMRSDVAALVVQQYQGTSMDAASQVVLAGDSDAFIANLSAASSYQDQRAQVASQYQTELSRLTLQQKAAKREVAGLARTRAGLADQKATIDDKVDEAKKLLDKLETKQRMALLSGVDPSTIDLDYQGRAGIAIKYAMAQVGKAYVWGAAGPSAFDCSGLMMAAWRQAGVGLPHSSGAQMGSGQRISESQLQPGDLVFYYSPVSHVGMYIGGGLIVNAENPSVGVKVTGLHAMPYSGAVHLG